MSILLLDAIVYKLQRNSYIMNRKNTMLWLFFLSALAWWAFEFFNTFYLNNWYYPPSSGSITSSVYWTGALRQIVKTIAFSTVIPAVFETADLLKALHLFDKKRRKKKSKHYLHRNTLYIIITLGIISLLLSVIFPSLFFGLIWLAFFLILDPINYLHKQPSIISLIRNKNYKILGAYFFSGYIVGFFWEFWNQWAVVKWKYSLPALGIFENYKLFEMPLLGYLAYGFFSLELFAMYYFTLSLRKDLRKVEKTIERKVFKN